MILSLKHVILCELLKKNDRDRFIYSKSSNLIINHVKFGSDTNYITWTI